MAGAATLQAALPPPRARKSAATERESPSPHTSQRSGEHQQQEANGYHPQVPVRITGLGARICPAGATERVAAAVEAAVDQVLVGLAIHDSRKPPKLGKKTHRAVPNVAIKRVSERRQRAVEPAECRGVKFVEAKLR